LKGDEGKKGKESPFQMLFIEGPKKTVEVLIGCTRGL